MSQKHCSLVILIFLLLFCSYQSEAQFNSNTKGGTNMAIQIKSMAFEEGGMIPKKYTCDGPNVSPSLSWDSIPEGTKSLALICDDPDAPGGTWVHWVIFNIPANIKELTENIPPQKTISIGAKQGRNDFGQIGYGGPCPPGGTHRYYFKLYALDKEINLEAGSTKAQLLNAIEGHMLAEGRLMGKYKR
jgi:Raf kinase inhibitor-like YbhB/YbcL family protein